MLQCVGNVAFDGVDKQMIEKNIKKNLVSI